VSEPDAFGTVCTPQRHGFFFRRSFFPFKYALIIQEGDPGRHGDTFKPAAFSRSRSGSLNAFGLSAACWLAFPGSRWLMIRNLKIPHCPSARSDIARV
jgi:hypothetical protein